LIGPFEVPSYRRWSAIHSAQLRINMLFLRVAHAEIGHERPFGRHLQDLSDVGILLTSLTASLLSFDLGMVG